MNKVKFTWRKRNKPRHTGARTHNAQDINKDKELPFCIVFCPKTDFYHKQHTHPPHTTYDANWGLLTQLQSTGSQRARHDRVTNTHTHTRSCMRRKRHPTPVLLPGEPHGWRSLAGCHPWGSKESDMAEQLTRTHPSAGGVDLQKLTKTNHAS